MHPSADTFEYVKTFRDITDCADAVYVMAYDFSPTNERLNDGHSSLSAVVGLLKYINLSKVVEDASKFMLGIPLYGRRVSNFGDAKTYEDLVSAMGDSFEPSRTFVDGVVFNSVEIVRAKVREAKKFGFGGVMVWELGQDVPIEEVGVSLFDAILEEAATVDDGEREYLHEDL
jgi:GH18 family chitinase